MAVVERHPEVEDYITEISIQEVRARGGIADLFEEGRLIILSDYRLDFDFEALAALSKSTETVTDPQMRRRLKKLVATNFFEGKRPKNHWGRLKFADPLRQQIYETLCGGQRRVFERVSRAIESAHRELNRIYEACFPDYATLRLIPSLRLTRTLFENLHWDNHSINEDFHQARIFANLDSRPRVWNIGRRLPDWMIRFYDEHDLGRFAGKDPNILIDYVTTQVLGGTRATWMDSEPRHRIAFDPGEVWLGESRLISHQIVYGESAAVYMWFVRVASMANPDNRFNARIEAVHRMRAASGQR
jgi:hypothetical protein